MATKRSRAAYEADTRAKESPYAIYGTPLPAFDSEVRDDGSFVPVWQQEVRDERGRKRLHGAFTGGFSAGYFNTVGSKDGWTPQTFVSSRNNRVKAQQKAEDFMDEEDVADAEESRQLQTASSYAGLGSTADESGGKDVLMDLARPAGETMGVKLLQRMGWRPGQGVGPKVRRKARLGDEDGADGEAHLFAPENSRMIGFVKKNDFKGLGYAGEASLSSLALRTTGNEQAEQEEETPMSRSKTSLVKATKKSKNGGIGIGILNDNGSDDEDPYEIGPKISYNRVIGGDKKGKKNGQIKSSVSSANPLLGTKPVFMSKKIIAKKSAQGFRKCHDGRLPLDGLILSTDSSDTSSLSRYPPPKIPEGWQSAKAPTSATSATDWKSTSDVAKTSSLDPKTRAALLGEALLPGKSVFDFLSPAARERLAAASGKTNLPQALDEAPPDGYKTSEADKAKFLWSLVPPLDKDLALAALHRGATGWMPYSEDPQKRTRYRGFLELRAGLSDKLPSRATDVKVDTWKQELAEFAHAAFVFRPATGLMATRFTSASQTYEGSSSNQKDGDEPLIRKPIPKPEDPAEAAAKMGMYGPLTRSVQPFLPTRLLCKRFNVRPPAGVQFDPGTNVAGESSTSGSTVKTDAMSKATLEKLMQDVAASRFASGGIEGGTIVVAETLLTMNAAFVKTDVVDVERNEALEAERPGDAVFKAIFGSDDEDD
ncbi:DUF1604-domain-containing protein [Tothia fuscella]|uniref:DUF1604-domain-containing protein n=1 Tax=Tothia fuscella TaxID=1048955 RepID=A0A9P4TX92_9PEZI|nr:DUF1604-domain-containing protein [Tothia fuscella]